MEIKQELRSPLISEMHGFAPAIKVGDFIYTSSILPFDMSGRIVAHAAQLSQCFKNLKYILKQVGIDFHSVMTVSIRYTNPADESLLLSVFCDSFEKPYPAIEYHGVSFLPANASFSISCMAIDTRELERSLEKTKSEGRGGCGGCDKSKGCSGCCK